MKMLDLTIVPAEHRYREYSSFYEESVEESEELCIAIPDMTVLKVMYRNFNSHPFNLNNLVNRHSHLDVHFQKLFTCSHDVKTLIVTQNRCPGLVAEISICLKLLPPDTCLQLVIILEEFDFDSLLENLKRKHYSISAIKRFDNKFYIAKINSINSSKVDTKRDQ